MKDWDMRPAHDLEKPLSEQLRSLERENGLVATGLNWAWWTFVRVYMGIYHRLTIFGRKHLPTRPPFVLIANHASHLDALVLACPLSLWQRDRIFPIAAGDVFFETPMMTGFAAFLLNALPMCARSAARTPSSSCAAGSSRNRAATFSFRKGSERATAKCCLSSRAWACSWPRPTYPWCRATYAAASGPCIPIISCRGPNASR